MTAGEWCPLCLIGEMRFHCGSPTCGWMRCPKCCTTFNPHTRAAYDRDYRGVDWPREGDTPKEPTT